MGRIVFAAAMSHVLDPDYYEAACGLTGRRKVEACMQAFTAGELDKAGEHEFLNWMVLIGAVTPAPADVRYFGELGRINLAAVEWRVA